jgi:hypothetical protein
MATLETIVSRLLQSDKFSQQEDETVINLSKEQEGTLVISGNVSIARGRFSGRNALSRILNTPELLELILEMTSPIDLLLSCSRVCKGFYEIMNSSLRLQRRLFLAPERTNWLLLPYPPRLLSGDFATALGHAIRGLSISSYKLVVRPVDLIDVLEGDSRNARPPLNLLVSQPPSKHLFAWRIESRYGWYCRKEIVETYDIETNNYVTLGDVLTWAHLFVSSESSYGSRVIFSTVDPGRD